MISLERQRIIDVCQELLAAYASGKLGDITMPEDSAPKFEPGQVEKRLIFFTLPMALNYQRDSYALWRAVRATWEDSKTESVFSLPAIEEMNVAELRERLLKHKLALQPNRHVATWQTLAHTIAANWGSVAGLLNAAGYDYLQLKDIVQGTHKRQFPYLSGPKIFNYWLFIISTYGGAVLSNREAIEIAPDTHITNRTYALTAKESKPGNDMVGCLR